MLRFVYDKQLTAKKKLVNDISVPSTLDGGTGHYVCYLYCEKTKSWWKFDDSEVTKCDSPVRGTTSSGYSSYLSTYSYWGGSSAGSTSSQDSPNPYILLYKHPSQNKTPLFSTVPQIPPELLEEVGGSVDDLFGRSKAYQEKKETLAKALAEEKRFYQEVWENISASTIDVEYNWISLPWLKQFLRKGKNVTVPPIDNNPILCPHDKLKIDAPMKRISRKAWVLLSHAFGGGPELTEASMCEECVTDHFREMDEKRRRTESFQQAKKTN